jgi:glycosyltransferase involved in cell wall biosynthesis
VRTHVDRRACVRVTHVVATSAFAGVERYITYVAPVFAARGIDVRVVGGQQLPMEAAFRGSGIAWSPARNVAEAVFRCLRARSAHIVHVHMTAAETAAAIALLGARGRIVTTRHFARHRGSSTVSRTVSRQVAKRIDRQIAISAFVADAVEGPCEVILNGVPDAPMGLHRARTVLVSQRLQGEKDTATALRAWQVSGLAERGWRMEVAGRGAEAEPLERLSVQLGTERSVELVGFVDDLVGRMADASVFLATAPAEPFGLAVVEAMACGLPVVAAAGGAHLETVGAVAPQSLFPPGDHGAAGDLLRAMAGDADRRRREGAALQAHQRVEMNVDHHVDRLLDVYEQVMSGSGR